MCFGDRRAALQDLWQPDLLLSATTLQTLKNNNILRPLQDRRAGSGKQRRIETVITTREYRPHSEQHPDAHHTGDGTETGMYSWCAPNNLITPKLTHSWRMQPSSDKSLHMCVLNPWSVCNKAEAVNDFIIDQDLDVLALTETLLTSTVKDNITISALLPAGYSILRRPRSTRGGGT